MPKSLRVLITPRIALLCFLLILIVMGAVPSYWRGNWSLSQLPPVINLKQIRAIRNTGLELTEWKTIQQETVELGGNKWSFQAIKGDYSKPILLLLRPQDSSKSQPQVDWADINSSRRWNTDSDKMIKFTVESSQLSQSVGASKLEKTVTVEARLFRAWTNRQTFAVLQWYAWSEGGHPAPVRWFWAEQLAQLHRRRVPWVAVCIQIPIRPLGKLEEFQPLATSLAKIVQNALMRGPLSRVEMGV
ncbi:MAG: cyanoexosortase B system-associated protein [Symploca sp. SIO1C4]|uniref:Cyanoexosortase B system-associated protein n=1 Tax=Symploca sp. SIO1C4 TaxID=2607765 RepID=A0A6B3N4Y0_9CYAN|nr:cyanoexosortase B system-associated protein [Symploca sp. SIO1C4]